MKNRKRKGLAIIMLGLMLCVGCGSNPAENSAESTSSSDGASESVQSGTAQSGNTLGNTSENTSANSVREERKVPVSASLKNAARGGTQFYNGEALTLQFWENHQDASRQICAFDGGEYGWIAIENADARHKGSWFLTNEDYGFTYLKNELTRVEADGQEAYSVFVESGIHDMCQLTDGQIFMLVVNVDGVLMPAKLDPDTGEYTLIEELTLGKDKRQYIAAGEEGLLLMNKEGFWSVDTQTGQLTLIREMKEYDYVPEYTIKDFKMVEGGCVELLFVDGIEALQPLDVEKYRTILTVCTLENEGWMQALVESFNASTYAYYAQISSPESNEVTAEAFLEQLNKDIAGGTGPDILAKDVIQSFPEYSKKGYLEDLKPYMDRFGVYTEDYFYPAFDYWKVDDAILGANIHMRCAGLKLKEEFLPEGEVPDMENFIDILLNNYTGSVFLVEGWEEKDIIEYLFGADEDFFGMVDWKNNTCDFESSLFGDMLEVAKLYADDGESNLPAMGSLMNTVTYGFYGYETREKLELLEEVYIGYFFDEGNYTKAYTDHMLAINANSAKKDAAWAFVQHALGDKYQTQKVYTSNRFIPVNREAFDGATTLERIEGPFMYHDSSAGFVYKAGQSAFERMGKNAYDKQYRVDNTRAAEIKEMLESARCASNRVEPVLDMILEETESYFAGERSIDEVSASLQEKVQAFLDEYGA